MSSLTNVLLLRRLGASIFGKNLIHTTVCAGGIKSQWHARYRKEMKERLKVMEEEGRTRLIKRSDYDHWNYEAELYAFGKRFGEHFDRALLREALTDSSYIIKEMKKQEELGIENPQLSMKSNKALSEAGLAIISNFVPKFLRATLPYVPEEGIQEVKNFLISEEVLGCIGSQLGLKDLILTSEYPPDGGTYACSLAAIIATLNESSGIERCQAFVRDFILSHLVGMDILDVWKIDDPLKILTGILAQNGKGPPEPRLIGELAKETIEAVFHVGLYSDRVLLGRGFGETVDTAVEVAAEDALRCLFGLTLSQTPLPFQEKPSDISAMSELSVTLSGVDLSLIKNLKIC